MGCRFLRSFAPAGSRMPHLCSVRARREDSGSSESRLPMGKGVQADRRGCLKNQPEDWEPPGRGTAGLQRV